MADRRVPGSSRAINAAAAGDASSTTRHPTPAIVSNMRSTSPYGTRSRNRGARVNYAEDKDNDMDYEYTTPYAPSSTSSRTNGNADIVSVGSSRKQTSSKDSKDARDSGAAAPAASTNAVAGKKRKGAQPPVAVASPKDIPMSNMLSFDNPYLKDGKLEADDGTVFEAHDHIYLICEPPGEPYYLARIMEFLHSNNDSTRRIDAIRVNWYYRPKDIQRKQSDTRVIFASMHSDVCPLSSIRGKCIIRHRTEVDNLDEYRKSRDHFYFERMFDRYMHRYYDVIPTKLVRNVPEMIRKVIVERWKYLLVEPQRGKELCAQMKECKRCGNFCASADSVHCAVCGCTYHMNCVRPPLLKKPSRGFAWACGPCNRAQERKLEARNTPALTAHTTPSGDVEEDIYDEEEDELSPGTGVRTETPSEVAVDLEMQPEPTPEQINFAKMWQMRYLGIHCHVEDVLDFDDRIYPRAVSRIGPRHQATVPPWPGRPVEYIKPIESKKRQRGGNKNKQNDTDGSGREKRPKWVMDEPPGYIERGGDDGTSSTLLFKIPAEGEGEIREKDRQKHLDVLESYMRSIPRVADKLGMPPHATNFIDKGIELLYANSFNEKKSQEQLSKVQAVRDLKEPRLKPDEVKRFEEGVAKYGSELHSVAKHVKTRKEADIVRFYYQWKKTERGKEIWGNYEGRKHKKEAKTKDREGGSKLVDDVADDEDDSAFDVEKATEKKRGFQCKFCHTRHSRQWRRAPGVPPGTLIPAEKSGSKRKNSEDKWSVSALCRRCAELWRRYAIQWEDPEEIQKKMTQGGGRAWKRKIDDELLRELKAAQEDAGAEGVVSTSSATPQRSVSGTATPDDRGQPPKKKAKTDVNGVTRRCKEKEADKEREKEVTREKERSKEKEKGKEPPPPPPEPPKPKMVTCGVCGDEEAVGKRHATCRDCKMTVHRTCYGLGEVRAANKWVCEMCANDKSPQVSTTYECVLCPAPHDPDAEPEKNNPYHKSSYKKKAAQEKVKRDSPEVDGRKAKETDKHRPPQPREPLKKTVHNNWAHVVCAIWTPEIKFSDAKSMQVVEGVGSIPILKFEHICKVCKESSRGACVQCTTCHAYVHVGCANKAGWTMGFDIQPVKGSRRDMVNIVKLGNETGNMTACVWCPEHEVKSTVHRINEPANEAGQTALELYLTTYKQADLTLTGTVRKANLVSVSTKASQLHRRNSVANPCGKEGSGSPTTVFIKTEGLEDRVGGHEGLLHDHVGGDGPKRCLRCNVDVSPLWWKVPLPSTPNGAVLAEPATNGNTTSRTLGLHCNRCHVKEKERSTSPYSVAPSNGHQTSKFAPLPPLHVFLAQQHAPQPPRPVMQQPPMQAALAPPPPSLPASGQSIPPAVQPAAVPAMPTHPQMAASVPPITQGMPLGLPPHPLAHQAPHQSPVHAVLNPVPPSQPQHMSPRAHHHSHSPHPTHGSPPIHGMSNHRMPPSHMATQQASPLPPPHQTHHLAPIHQAAHHASPPPVHVSPHSGTGSHMMSVHSAPGAHPPMAMHRPPQGPHAPAMQPQVQGSQMQGPQAQASQVQAALPPQPQPQPQPQPSQDEPRRVMSGASGSPALANLLS